MAVNEIIEEMGRERLSSPVRPRYFWAKPGLSEWTDRRNGRYLPLGLVEQSIVFFHCAKIVSRFVARRSELEECLKGQSDDGGIVAKFHLQSSRKTCAESLWGSQASARPSIMSHKKHYAGAPRVVLAF